STQVTRTYDSQTSVYLTAPAAASGNIFQKWQVDGVDYSSTQGINVLMNANHTLTAVYVPASQCCSSSPSGLVAWYSGDGSNVTRNNGVSGLIYDIEGGNDGALVISSLFTAGKVGNGFSFDGVAAYADLGSWFTLQNFTIEMWVNPNA